MLALWRPKLWKNGKRQASAICYYGPPTRTHDGYNAVKPYAKPSLGAIRGFSSFQLIELAGQVSSTICGTPHVAKMWNKIEELMYWSKNLVLPPLKSAIIPDDSTLTKGLTPVLNGVH